MVTEYNDPGCRPMSMLNLAGFLARSSVNGPGIRAVVWVQGCPFRCKGCFNETFQPFSPAMPVHVDELAGTILSAPGIEGVTFSGGEPFAQAGPLAALGDRLRRAGLSIITYSGYTAEQLAGGDDPSWPFLLAVSDLIITGPYIAELAVSDPLKGSANQQVIPLGTRIPVPRERARPAGAGSRMEFTIAQDGTVTMTGFPSPTHIAQFSLRCRGA